MSKAKTGTDEPTIIKKYANRRLYDTGRSSYVTLDDLCEMVQEGHNFKVIDAKSGDDITRSVLTQIIADQESGDETLLPTNFLRTLIGFYGNNMQTMLPGYLEQTMNVFVQNQEHMQDHINKSFEGMRNMSGMENMFPQAPNLEEMTRKNMEMFERAMKMMPPFNMGYNAQTEEERTKK
ncbi:MAG: polyhydroxyalkanoate synthesis repressor PhaR [Alphaproteobacteria bacterium]